MDSISRAQKVNWQLFNIGVSVPILAGDVYNVHTDDWWRLGDEGRRNA